MATFAITVPSIRRKAEYTLQNTTSPQEYSLINAYTEESYINTLFSTRENCILERLETSVIIKEGRVAMKGWRQTAAEPQIHLKLMELFY